VRRDEVQVHVTVPLTLEYEEAQFAHLDALERFGRPSPRKKTSGPMS
jgi:hypothetical protein